MFSLTRSSLSQTLVTVVPYSHKSQPMAMLIGKVDPLVRQPLTQQETHVHGVASLCHRSTEHILLSVRKIGMEECALSQSVHQLCSYGDIQL